VKNNYITLFPFPPLKEHPIFSKVISKIKEKSNDNQVDDYKIYPVILFPWCIKFEVNIERLVLKIAEKNDQ
jgi:hypothetical protein